MAPATLIAIIHPKAGKADRVVELLLETSKVVQAKEPYVSEYSCYREINFKDGLEDIVMFERYTSMADQDTHMIVPHVLSLLDTWKKEDLMREDPMIKNLEHAGGFAGR